jgi:hypothetical protein
MPVSANPDPRYSAEADACEHGWMYAKNANPSQFGLDEWATLRMPDYGKVGKMTQYGFCAADCERVGLKGVFS